MMTIRICAFKKTEAIFSNPLTFAQHPPQVQGHWAKTFCEERGWANAGIVNLDTAKRIYDLLDLKGMQTH